MVGSGWKAVADFSGPMEASKGAKATREDLHVRGGEHSDYCSIWHWQLYPRGYRYEWTYKPTSKHCFFHRKSPYF